VGRVGFEPTTPAMSRLAQSSKFWKGFETFLNQTNNHRSTQDRLNYAHKYIHILQQADARELLELNGEKRIHVMKSLAALAKYAGCYDSWQQMRERFRLKWSNSDAQQQFSLIFDEGKDLNHMLCWLKETYAKLPQKYANILVFNALTGLRPSEACMAINLIQTRYDDYVNQRNQTLEHFRFPFFIRRTKKAYISMYSGQIINVAKNTHSDISYSLLKYIFRKHGLGLHTSFCRKIFATYLRTHGIEQETIDLLQGRAPRSVFARHYFKPTFKEERKKIIACLENLYREINIASQCCIP
jgi:hypothetical protein